MFQQQSFTKDKKAALQDAEPTRKYIPVIGKIVLKELHVIRMDVRTKIDYAS